MGEGPDEAAMKKEMAAVLQAQQFALGKLEKKELTFGFGDHGMCFQKEFVTVVGPASQAIAYGVKVGWKIIDIDGQDLQATPDLVREMMEKHRKLGRKYTVTFIPS